MSLIHWSEGCCRSALEEDGFGKFSQTSTNEAPFRCSLSVWQKPDRDNCSQDVGKDRSRIRTGPNKLLQFYVPRVGDYFDEAHEEENVSLSGRTTPSIEKAGGTQCSST